MRMDSKGFTLIEVLVVVVIIGILAAVAIPRFMNARADAMRSSIQSDLRNLLSAQESYHGDAGSYAADISELSTDASPGVAISINEASAGGWAATATHAGFPGVTCGVFIGTASPENGAPATTQGAVACSR